MCPSPQALDCRLGSELLHKKTAEMWRQTLTVVNRYRSKTTLVSSWVGKVRYLSANNNKFPIPDSFFNEELENLKELEDAASAVMLNGGIENLASLHVRMTICISFLSKYYVIVLIRSVPPLKTLV